MKHTNLDDCPCFNKWLRRQKVNLFQFCSWGVNKQVDFHTLILKQPFCANVEYQKYLKMIEKRMVKLIDRPLSADTPMTSKPKAKVPWDFKVEEEIE